MSVEDQLHIIEGAVQKNNLVVHRSLMFHPQAKHHQRKPKTSCLEDRTQTI